MDEKKEFKYIVKLDGMFHIGYQVCSQFAMSEAEAEEVARERITGIVRNLTDTNLNLSLQVLMTDVLVHPDNDPVTAEEIEKFGFKVGDKVKAVRPSLEEGRKEPKFVETMDGFVGHVMVMFKRTASDGEKFVTVGCQGVDGQHFAFRPEWLERTF